MAKEKVIRKPKKKKQDVQDKVIFMAAYDVHMLKHKLPKLSLKKDKKNLLDQFHIRGISSNNTYVSSGGKNDYTVEYDSFNRVSAFIRQLLYSIQHRLRFQHVITWKVFL